MKNLELPLDPDEAARDKIVKVLRNKALNEIAPSILTSPQTGEGTCD